MKKIFIGLFLVICIGVGLVISPLVRPKTSPDQKPVSPVMGLETRKVTDTPVSPTPALPKTISIPSIGITANVEQVGQDSQGRMDVPKTNQDTAWYDVGFRPGANGNAVIDGHLDTVTGAPAVFWNISKLKSGDLIVITDENNRTYSFSVTKQTAYPYNSLPLQQIFGSSDSPHLNLITCNGTWDKVNKNYSQRIVVYADLKK